MPIEAGQQLLHYRLIGKIGEGGMGVVWKALDTTLDREVAIKVLPEAFIADTERLTRFEREAKLLAALNHPNIASIYGLHEEPATESEAAPRQHVSEERVDRSVDVDRPYVYTTDDALTAPPVAHISASSEGAAQVASS